MLVSGHWFLVAGLWMPFLAAGRAAYCIPLTAYWLLLVGLGRKSMAHYVCVSVTKVECLFNIF